MKNHLLITALVLFLFAFNSAVYSQYGETIRTGRPGQAIGPFTLGKSVFQVQSGVDYYKTKPTVSTVFPQSVTVGSSVFRLGLTEHFEVGTAIEYTHRNVDINGISKVSLATRWNVRDRDGFKPAVGIQFNLGLPVVSENFKPTYPAPKINVVTGFAFTDRLSAQTNTGLTWNGNSASPTGFHILNLGYSISNRFSVFAEWYGFVSESNFGSTNWENKFDSGFAFLVNNDLQLDLYGGYNKNYNLNDIEAKEWFISLGVSWRCDWRDKN